MDSNERESIIVKTSWRDFFANVFIGLGQLLIGILSNSIAIMSESVNSINGASIAFVNVMGIKQAHKPADKKHPYGYGRLEYFTSAYLAIILLLIASIAIYKSYGRIIGNGEPEEVELNYYMAAFIFLASLFKIYLGRHAIHIGKEYNNNSLRIMGKHTIVEVFVEIFTVISILVAIVTGIHIDSYLGLLIGIFLLRNGILAMKDVISTLIGLRIDSSSSKLIKKEIREHCAQIHGAYDLVIHDYGENVKMGTCNVELNENLTVREADSILHETQSYILNKYNVYLVFGIYSINESNKELLDIKNRIEKIALNHEYVINIHGFYKDENMIRFDMTIDFEEKDSEGLVKKVILELNEIYDYEFQIKIDRDVSD